MSQVVTQLVVAADGSLRTLDQFERGMEQAGRATDYTTGAVTDFQRRMDAARTAMERGNAISTQTVQRKSAEQRAWERWSATVDKTSALRIRLEREAANAAVAASNAVNMGYATQEQALATLMALEQRHNEVLARQIGMHDAQTAAVRNSTAAFRQNTAAANDNLAARGMYGEGNPLMSPSNIGFQFQDIAVTAAMGMNPLMIGLQQGTQLSMALGGQGLTGTVRSLAVAFGSLVSPVSLATIAFTTLGAAGIQALMGIFNGTEDATDAMGDNLDQLMDTLRGYESVQKAVEDFTERTAQRPEELASSDLGLQRDEAEAQLRSQIDLIGQAQSALNDLAASYSNLGVGPRMPQDLERLQQLIEAAGLSADSSIDDVDQLMIAVRNLADNITAQGPRAQAEVRAQAERFEELLTSVRDAIAEVDRLGVAITALPSEKYIDIIVSSHGSLDAATNAGLENTLGERVEAYEDAVQSIERLTPDLRTAREQVEAELAAGLEAALTDEQVSQLQQRYDSAMAAIAEQEAQRAAREAANGRSPADQWQAANDNFQQRIDQQRLELSLIGQSTFEIERQRAAFDLLNQAKAAGIPITSQVTSQINLMATEYATLTDQMRQQQLMASTAISINNTLANGFADLWTGIITGSKSASEAIGGLLLQLGQMAINSAFMSLFGGGTAGGIGGALAGIFMPQTGMSLGGSGVVGGSGTYVPGAPDNTLFVARVQKGEPYAFGQQALTGIGRRAANQNQHNDNRRMGDLHLHINGSGLSRQELAAAIADGIREYDASLAPKVENKVRTMQRDPRAADGGW